MPEESIVDIYCHIFPHTFLQQMNQIAPQLGNISTRLRGVKKPFDLEERFREMDNFGDYREIISLPKILLARETHPGLSSMGVGSNWSPCLSRREPPSPLSSSSPSNRETVRAVRSPRHRHHPPRIRNFQSESYAGRSTDGFCTRPADLVRDFAAALFKLSVSPDASQESPSRRRRSFMSENGQTFPAVGRMMHRWKCPLTTSATAHSRPTMRASTAGFSSALRRRGFTAVRSARRASRKRKNCRFFPSAAAAQSAGFRPCLRCRPEISSDAAAWRGTSNTVSRALALIAEGALDGGESSVSLLAERLGMGERQLRRLFDKHLSVPPVAVAQTRRVLFAKQLIQETQLPMAAIAEASGFGSVRRFNDAFLKLYRRPPREPRVKKSGESTAIVLRLGYKPPYDWDAILGFLSQRAIEGVETVTNGCYHRTIAVEGGVGTVEVRLGARDCLVATIRISEVRGLLSIVARLRRLFDLDADVKVIGAHLSEDRSLAPLVAQRPGLRSPGCWDAFELAVRAVLGQQITVSAARNLAGKLAKLAGEKIARGDGLSHIFPTPPQMMKADLSRLGMPRAHRLPRGARRSGCERQEAPRTCL
jgi:methylphosphotriester-DNA--protein-cysteine methyltransferase